LCAFSFMFTLDRTQKKSELFEQLKENY
jgi:hypothetical protein